MPKKTIEEKYKKLTQIEHVLKRPGMYVGPIEPREELIWIFNKKTNKMEQRELKYSPGLYKIFDEIIMNAVDESTRDTTLTKICIDIDKEKNEISIFNNGKGIEVVKHKKHNMYVPQLIFGELLTSASYDDNDKRISAGVHGLGAKLTNIFSKYFKVEIGDPESGLKFTQIYKDNLSKKMEPKISKYKNKNGFVKITYRPDFKRFDYETLEKNDILVMKKRVYDISAITSKKVSVFLNNKKIDIKTFDNYVNLYIGDKDNTMRVVEKCKDRWEVIVSPSLDEKFQQISFVNGIYTSNGGKHVNYIVDQIVKKVGAIIKKKHKKVQIRDSYIKDRIWVFIKCIIENPEFSSQTKEELTTRKEKFGSTCQLPNTFIKKIADKLGIAEDIISFIETKEMKTLEKKVGVKRSTLRDIPKLDDANWAGTKKSIHCTLILTEGDSAKATAISGISALKDGRYRFGVYPLRGKFKNVRDASGKDLLNNKEFSDLKRILGLTVHKKYTEKNINELRYGSILLMMDADIDGSHIKGLIINMFHYFFPSLLKIPDFIKILITPIVKVTCKDNIKSFYTLTDYEKWKTDVGKNIKHWKIKYYKGLGTNTARESKEYFIHLDKNTIEFNFEKEDNEAILLAFDKKQADNRKLWLKKFYDRDSILNIKSKKNTYADFINKELIHFSNADNIRSIPNLCDGLKPSQRKILYSGFKRKLFNEVKVSQFIGYVSEHSSYHHGEMSLAGTIISMSQNYVGSNNLNLYMPIGQFGTRLQGGKDHSSPRYIFTKLNKLTRLVYNSYDDALLEYLNDDGISIEPLYYVSILPMSLVNGAEGIGTGYSTFIPCFNPEDIVNNLIHKIKDDSSFKQMSPWYYGFEGKIEKIKNNIYMSKGLYKKNNKKHVIEVTELPIGKWTQDYKVFLEKMIEQKKKIKKKENRYCFL